MNNKNTIEGFSLNTGSSTSDRCTTAILLMTFNRPEETRKSFAQIRKAKPLKLYISGDGPRPAKPADNQKVNETREYVLQNIDWECEVKTLFREKNLGCREGVASAIDWFFEYEEEGIIIEDDIVVADSFFPFASQLLDHYRNDTRIMCITGVNHQDNIKRGTYSYYFSQLNHVWGWASWRRAWKEYRIVEKKIPQLIAEIQAGKCPGFTHNTIANFMWQHNLVNAYNSVVDTWDYIWTFAVLVNAGLTCTPNVNLIEHIGYGEDSTHIKQPLNFTVLQRHEIQFPIRHPIHKIYDKEADDYTYKKVFFLDHFTEAYKKQQTNQIQPANSSTIPQIFQNNGNLKVLFIATKDTGGAGGAARRMHEAVLSAGIDSVMLVFEKLSKTDKVAQIEIDNPAIKDNNPSVRLLKVFDSIQQPLLDYPQRSNQEMFTSTDSIIGYNNLKPYIQQADIINLHWIDGFFDYKNAPDVFKGKKIIWTLHDMYQFTGGCHYSFGCENYRKQCASCPQLVKDNSTTALTRDSFSIKAQAYNNLDIQIITPSAWLAECTRNSTLMKGFPVEVIPNTFNTDNFKPVDKITARQKFNLPVDRKIILFGADSILSPIKNLQILIEALNRLCQNNSLLAESFSLVLFGRGNVSTANISFNIIQLGLITSAQDMSYIYSSADFLVLPSLMDNLPNIMCEALACGTPVIGFNIGGLPDLIETGKTGYLAQPYDIDELNKGILWGLNTAAGNEEIKNNCLNVINNKLIQRVILNKVFTLYKKLIPDGSIPFKNIDNIISSNDSFRKNYLITVNSLSNNQLIDFIKKVSDKLREWFTTNLLPYSNITEQEQELKNKYLNIIKNNDINNSEYLRALISAMVLIPPEELGRSISINNIDYLSYEIFLQYLFNYKELPSDAISINEKLANIMFYAEQILNNSKNNSSATELSVISNSLYSFNKILFYCADGGLKELMKLYSELLARYLILNHAKIDYTFPPRDTNQKIRLGVFLSAFSEHTETYATIPVFRHLDRSKFEIFAYVLHDTDSQQQKQCLNFVDHFTVLSKTNIPPSVNEIRSHNLDILLIGTNVTAGYSHNIIYATHRLARIQAVHFCNPCTTGINNIDYFITGNNFDLDKNDFTEKLIFNNNSGICFEGETVVRAAELSLSRKDLNIPDNATLFITGANFYKFTWELREFWANLLNEIPDSYLITLPFGPAWTNKYPVNEFIQSIKNQFMAQNVNPDRLIILKPLPTREDVRKIVGMCDIYLDSFPYSGATSLLDPFYTHIPMICYKTNTIRGGQGSGMLEDTGLHELIVNSKKEYITLAKKLVHDLDYRQEISMKIQTVMNNNPDFLNTIKYAEDMQRIYLQMIAEYDNQHNNNLVINNDLDSNTETKKIKPNDICSCGSGLKYKKCCGK